MLMYNLIEYSNNYCDTLGSLWQFKRDETNGDDDLTVDNSHIPNNSLSFKSKASLITNRNALKIVVRLKNLSNFWRSLEVPLINCKAELLLSRNPNCVLTSLGAKLYVPIVTLSVENNAKLSKLLSEGFKRSVY